MSSATYIFGIVLVFLVSPGLHGSQVSNYIFPNVLFWMFSIYFGMSLCLENYFQVIYMSVFIHLYLWLKYRQRDKRACAHAKHYLFIHIVWQIYIIISSGIFWDKRRFRSWHKRICMSTIAELCTSKQTHAHRCSLIHSNKYKHFQ